MKIKTVGRTAGSSLPLGVAIALPQRQGKQPGQNGQHPRNPKRGSIAQANQKTTDRRPDRVGNAQIGGIEPQNFALLLAIAPQGQHRVDQRSRERIDGPKHRQQQQKRRQTVNHGHQQKRDAPGDQSCR